MYIERFLQTALDRYLDIFPVTAVTGPRQSGKTTLLRHHLTDTYEYITFDDPQNVNFFYSDPEGFFNRYKDKIIFDEVQKVPEIFQYLKMTVDNERLNYGRYIITGSSQFSLVNSITESLAGRVGLLTLLPFQYLEIPESERAEQILFGSYPELIIRKYKHHTEWYGSYFSTYIERDVRSLYKIGNLRDFGRLVYILAAQCTQELNMSRLAREIGVTVKTIQAWISVLEASYIIFLLPPYHKNLGKRIVKRPKLYFYDTGLICYLTGVETSLHLNRGPLAGPVFENYIVSEIKKAGLHGMKKDTLYYFRNNTGIEADLIIENLADQRLIFMEIKNNETHKYKMTDNIRTLISLETSSLNKSGILLYRGKENGAYSEHVSYMNALSYLEEIS